MSTALAYCPPPVDALGQAIEQIRPDLDRSISIHQRARNFWAAVKCCRGLGSSDVVMDEFRQLAADTGFTNDIQYGAATVEHLIRWGMFDRDPFGAPR